MKIFPIKDKIFSIKYVKRIKSATSSIGVKKSDMNINGRVNNNCIDKVERIVKRIKKEVWDMLDGIV